MSVPLGVHVEVGVGHRLEVELVADRPERGGHLAGDRRVPGLVEDVFLVRRQRELLAGAGEVVVDPRLVVGVPGARDRVPGRERLVREVMAADVLERPALQRLAGRVGQRDVTGAIGLVDPLPVHALQAAGAAGHDPAERVEVHVVVDLQQAPQLLVRHVAVDGVRDHAAAERQRLVVVLGAVRAVVAEPGEGHPLGAVLAHRRPAMALAATVLLGPAPAGDTAGGADAVDAGCDAVLPLLVAHGRQLRIDVAFRVPLLQPLGGVPEARAVAVHDQLAAVRRHRVAVVVVAGLVVQTVGVEDQRGAEHERLRLVAGEPVRDAHLVVIEAQFVAERRQHRLELVDVVDGGFPVEGVGLVLRALVDGVEEVGHADPLQPVVAQVVLGAVALLPELLLEARDRPVLVGRAGGQEVGPAGRADLVHGVDVERHLLFDHAARDGAVGAFHELLVVEVPDVPGIRMLARRHQQVVLLAVVLVVADRVDVDVELLLQKLLDHRVLADAGAAHTGPGDGHRRVGGRHLPLGGCEQTCGRQQQQSEHDYR